ncbi:MAG: LPS export ABC transporter periplasmic protein LptC [bacterium]
MEHQPRSRIPWALLATAAVALVIAYFIIRDVRHYVAEEKPSLIFSDLYVRVYKKQKIQWEFKAKKVTVSQDRTGYDLENITDGILNRKKKPPFNFSAEHGRYNTRTEDLDVDTPVEFTSKNGDYFRAKSAHWQGKRKLLNIDERVEVGLDGNNYEADSLEGKGEDLDLVTLRGNVLAFLPDIEETGSKQVKTEIKEAKIEKKHLENFTVRSHEMRYDGKKKELLCLPKTGAPIFIPGEDGGEDDPKHFVLMDTDRFEMKSRELFAQFDEKFVNSRGDVWIRRKAEEPDPDKSKLVQALQKRDAFFTTEEATYHWKEKRIDVPSRVDMEQENLDGTAGRAVIHSENDWTRFEDGVVLHQKSGEWLMKDGVIKENAPEKTKEIARDETTVHGETILVNFETDDIFATGSVIIQQEKRSLYGESARYAGDTRTWRILGSPVAVDEEDTLAAEIFIIDEEKERFLAIGSARSEFLPEKDEQEDIDEFFRERDGEEQPRERYEREKVVVEADMIDHDEKNEMLDATGGVVVSYRDIRFEAPRMHIDYNEKTIGGIDGTTITDKYSVTTAEKFLANWSTRDATLAGTVRMKHSGREATEEKKEIDPFTVECEELQYNSKSKTGTARGNPLITSEGRWISSEKADFDADAGVYDFSGDVKMHQDDGNWLKENGYIDPEEDERAWKIARDAADAACDEARFAGEDDFFRLAGNVVVEQKDRTLEADWLEFDGKTRRFTTGGEVHLFQTKGDWLFEAELISEEDDEEIRERAKGRIDLYADLLESNYGEKKLYLEGDVFAKQDRSTFESDHVWHDDKTRTSIFEGDVRINDEKGRSLSAERITYDGKEKIFEAFERVAGAGYVEEEE